MPRGIKSSYTEKQKRQAQKIMESYLKRGVAEKIATARAWATVNKLDGGGKKKGPGRRNQAANLPAKTGGRKTGPITTSKGKKST